MNEHELLNLLGYYGAACHAQGWCLARCDRDGEDVALEQGKTYYREIAGQIRKLYEERRP